MMIVCKPERDAKRIDREKIRPSAIRTPWPRTGKPHMTIAIGMLCAHGAVIAADTKLTLPDGSTQYGEKVHIQPTTSGVFVSAFACDDVDAARTLRNDIFEELKKSDPSTLAKVEDVVRPVMAKWAAACTYNLPDIAFIIGASVKGDWAPNKNDCGGIGLYYCKPPNTMLLKHFLEQEPSTYVAIGGGAAITDPLQKILFGGPMSNPKTTLKQIAYLIHRAKTDYGQFCGGATTAIFIREKDPAAFQIHPIYMDRAENMSGVLDHHLRIATSSVFADSLNNAEEFINLSRSLLKTDQYRTLRFISQFNQEICDDGIVRQLNIQT